MPDTVADVLFPHKEKCVFIKNFTNKYKEYIKYFLPRIPNEQISAIVNNVWDIFMLFPLLFSNKKNVSVYFIILDTQSSLQRDKMKTCRWFISKYRLMFILFLIFKYSTAHNSTLSERYKLYRKKCEEVTHRNSIDKLFNNNFIIHVTLFGINFPLFSHSWRDLYVLRCFVNTRLLWGT